MIWRADSSLGPFSDDFFVGIGDINSSFLPKLKPSPLAASTSSSSSSSSTPPAPSPASPPTETTLVLPTTADTEHLAEAQLHVIEDQIEERSLAKQQEKLEAEEEEASGSGSRSASASVDGESESGGRGKALLKADDDELERLDTVSADHSVCYVRGLQADPTAFFFLIDLA